MKEKNIVRKFTQRDPQVRFRYDERLEVFRYLRGNLAKMSAKDGGAVRRSRHGF